MRLTLGLALALTTSAAAHAQTDCATLADPAERLACFDRQTATPQATAWMGTTQRDPFSDVESRVVGAQSNEPSSCTRQHAVLALVCTGDDLALMLSTGCFMGDSRAAHEVQYRPADGDITRLTMIGAPDGQTLAWTYAAGIDVFLGRIAAAPEVHFRITPARDAQQTLTFSTAGLADAVSDVELGCGVQDALAGSE